MGARGAWRSSRDLIEGTAASRGRPSSFEEPVVKAAGSKAKTESSARWVAPQERPFLRIEGIEKQFDGFAAVDGVSVDIYRKELFCLLGASGCGKTTLLRMLAGFEQPTAGRIYLDGSDITEVPPYERPINMMFQSYALFPHMSVEKIGRA